MSLQYIVTYVILTGTAHVSYSAWLFSNVFVCFSCFLFLKEDQFYQGWTAEHLAEHTTKSFTGFWLFGRFTGCLSWRSRSSGQTLQDLQMGEASVTSAEFPADQIWSRPGLDWDKKSALAFFWSRWPTTTSNYIYIYIFKKNIYRPTGKMPGMPDYHSSPDRDAESRVKSHGGRMCFYINERWCTDVTVLKKMCCSDLETLFINCKPFYSPREICSFILVSVYIPPQAHVSSALQKLADLITDTEQKHPDSV